MRQGDGGLELAIERVYGAFIAVVSFLNGSFDLR